MNQAYMRGPVSIWGPASIDTGPKWCCFGPEQYQYLFPYYIYF